MSEPVYVLDASALLATLFEEAGSDVVETVLPGARMSAVNFSEVVAKLSDHGLANDDILRDLAELDIVVCDVDRKQAETAGLLRRRTKIAGLSLGDRACLALAAALGATAVTADRAWAELSLDLDIQIVR
jgi:PIN domain nuclease of toxin-antitoxin system